MSGELVTGRQGPVLVVRLNRPEARNALTRSLLAGIGAAVLQAESDPEIRVVVLTGTGDRAFCAGMDLRSFSSGEDFDGTPDEASAGYYRLIRGQTTVPFGRAAPGTAIGGGLELLLGCDIVVASSQARFGFPEVRRGLFPAGGGTFIGTRIPMGIALEMILTGDLVDADRAYQLGLVNSVVPPDQVLATALALAGRVAENAPLGLAAAKELVRLGVTDAARASSRLREWQATVFASEDAKEGAAAFMEKRTPLWKGR
jgi:enoyl-CoA hydratase/carnithine racemase